MSDHFYRMNIGDVFDYNESTVNVGTATSGSYDLELRVTDGTVTAEQVYEFCEKLADFFANNDPLVVVAGTLTG